VTKLKEVVKTEKTIIRKAAKENRRVEERKNRR